MGLYLNPRNKMYEELMQSNAYVDKTGLLNYTNSCIGTTKKYIASSRPRRFGKTLAAQMLATYYGKGCEQQGIFDNMEIAQDASYEKHLNQYDVIFLDIQWMRSVALNKFRGEEKASVLDFIQTEVVGELRQAYPQYVSEDENTIASALAHINLETGKQFVIIIDEWDCIFREDKDETQIQTEYISFLRSLFKGSVADAFVKLAYITGILPIKKYGTQSALNNFRELTMVSPGGIAQYIGFTENEVRALCKRSGMPFAEMKKWYDGYFFYKTGHVYNPNSVMEAIANEEFENYWSRTETYESLKFYIEMDFDGLRQMIVDMLGGRRCKVHTESFQNDMTSFKSASDILTLLIHLGYLAYDSKTKEAYIPNEEIRDSFILSIMDDGWGDVYKAIQSSERLLKATLDMEETAVADMVREVHMQHTSSLTYNNEISLASVVQAAYYSAAKDYTLIRELPAGEGIADMAFIPKRRSKKPALLIELKWDKSAEGAIEQIKEKKYAARFKDYQGELLLVGINYDKKTKELQCRIEKYKKSDV